MSFGAKGFLDPGGRTAVLVDSGCSLKRHLTELLGIDTSNHSVPAASKDVRRGKIWFLARVNGSSG